MQQYHDHLKLILEKGTEKAPAREGMPSSRSYFGHQNRYNLQEGFPILTTKKVPFRWVVVELLWFLKGDTNIKYLDEKGVDKMWHEDSYQFYKKIASGNLGADANDIYWKNEDSSLRMFSFEEFCQKISYHTLDQLPRYKDYTLGSCGMQYGALWRRWNKDTYLEPLTLNIPEISEESKKEFLDAWQNAGVTGMMNSKEILEPHCEPLMPLMQIDQIKNLIEGLLKNPEGRRHIVTAWNPNTLNDMALNACHSSFQMNCRKLSDSQRRQYVIDNFLGEEHAYTISGSGSVNWDQIETEFGPIPQYYLDCHMYQRSADMFLGTPFNISSYALLTHILAAICNMIPGELVHTFGDSHIYSNHIDQVNEILSRDPQKYKLPKLGISDKISHANWQNWGTDDLLDRLESEDFLLQKYESYPHIPAPLSTGLAK